MKYRSVYSFCLFDEVVNGKKVYALDRKLKKVVLVNDLTAEQLAAVMHSDKEEPSRYEFWYEETETEETKEKEVSENA